jgi:hypothetical protein
VFGLIDDDDGNQADQWLTAAPTRAVLLP